MHNMTAHDFKEILQLSVSVYTMLFLGEIVAFRLGFNCFLCTTSALTRNESRSESGVS